MWLPTAVSRLIRLTSQKVSELSHPAIMITLRCISVNTAAERTQDKVAPR
jgi:hypothetical protein